MIPPDTNDIELITTKDFNDCRWLSAFNGKLETSFYGEGRLPFVFGAVPEAKYYICQVKKTIKPPYFVSSAWQTQLVPVEVLNNTAWVLATSENPADRDGQRAVLFAERACQLTGYRETVMVGTLAAAYAEAGRFDDAIATAQKACDMASAAGKPQLLKANQQLFELYRAHQPYHEAAQTP